MITDWQNIFALGLVAAAVAYLLRRIRRTGKTVRDGGCAGCPGCREESTGRTLVTIKPPHADRQVLTTEDTALNKAGASGWASNDSPATSHLRGLSGAVQLGSAEE